MRKNTRIQRIDLYGKNVHAFDTEGNSVKLTRQQRELFYRYKSPKFLENIFKEFSADILAEDFFIMDTLMNEQVYPIKPKEDSQS